MVMIEVIANDRLGKKVRVKCDSEDTVGDLKVSSSSPKRLRVVFNAVASSAHCRNLLPHRRVQIGGRLFSRNGIHRIKTISSFRTMKFTMG